MPVQSHFWYKMFDLTDVPLKLALVIPEAYERRKGTSNYSTLVSPILYRI